MGKRTIVTDKVARTKGPYVQGVAVKDCELVYVTGVVARDAQGNMVAPDDMRGSPCSSARERTIPP